MFKLIQGIIQKREEDKKIEIHVLKNTENKNMIKLFETKATICKLIILYQHSQMEHQRNGRLTADVGTSREKDLVAYMKYVLGDTIDYNIDNEKEEDVRMGSCNISIKHSSVKTLSNASIKLRWTENKETQKLFMGGFIFKCDLLIVYVRFRGIDFGELEVMYNKKNSLNIQLENFGKTGDVVFKLRENSNGRGIEFSRKFFNSMVNTCDYHLKVKFSDIGCKSVDCIEKRIQELVTI